MYHDKKDKCKEIVAEVLKEIDPELYAKYFLEVNHDLEKLIDIVYNKTFYF